MLRVLCIQCLALITSNYGGWREIWLPQHNRVGACLLRPDLFNARSYRGSHSWLYSGEESLALLPMYSSTEHPTRLVLIGVIPEPLPIVGRQTTTKMCKWNDKML
jgi:hypothetical protein